MATTPHPNRLKRLRRAQGDMSYEELASRLRSGYGSQRGEPVSERTIRRWENTGRIPTDRAVELAAIFGCSVDHLLGADLLRGRGKDGNGGNGNGNGERVAA